MNYLFAYLCGISLFAAVLTVHDKRAAKKRHRRVRERTLLIVSAIGGSVAMLLTMLAVRHKTRHLKFMAGIPLIMVLQIAAVLVVLHGRNLL
ncbi:MAG: DUF1294 domain-containing protein [Oscillospiraceae bacterium]